MISALFYNTLLTGAIMAVLILFVFLVSPTLNKRYQAYWRLNIWKVFMVFLIVPVGFILRLMINSEKIQNSIATINNRTTSAPSIPQEAVSFQMIAENQQASIWTKLVDAGPQWIAIIWGVGACIVAFYLLGAYLHFIRDMKNNSMHIQDDDLDKIQTAILLKHKRKPPLMLYQCAKISSPMIIGIFKPTIFIPKRDYNITDLQIILTHELTHYLRKDLPYKGLFILTLILHWYNPFVHMMAKAAGKDMELCCDQDVIKKKNKQFRSDYSDVIMGEIVNHKRMNGTLFACISCDKKIMEERFKNIFSNKKRGGIYSLGALALVVAISGFAYANDRNVPDFSSSGYQQLLEKAIANKNAQIKAKIEEGKIKNRPYKDLDNFEELAALVSDENGNYDIYEVYALAGMEPPEQVLPDFNLSSYEFHFTTINGCIEPHILGNGERAIYETDVGGQWELRKDDIVRVNIFADIHKPDLENINGREYANKGTLEFGYLKNGGYVSIEEFNIEGEKQIEFSIPKDGAYNFYLFSKGSLSMTIKWISIDIK